MNFIKRQVLAHYYMWYGTPKVSGEWRAWDNGLHNPDVVINGKRDICAKEHPINDAYDSNDPKVMERHLKLAKSIGLDGLIVSWWGHGCWFNKSFELLLKKAERHGIKITINYELPRAPTIYCVRVDLRHILKYYSKSKMFFRIDGKPVIFLYEETINVLSFHEWKQIVEEFKEKIVMIADTNKKNLIHLFDGAYTYAYRNAVIRKKNLDKYISHFIKNGKHHKKITCGTVMPGFDDTSIKRTRSFKYTIWKNFFNRGKDFVISRNDGNFYRYLWSLVFKNKPDIVMITSFNEWHESTEIEPSLEFKNMYVDLTKNFIKKFKNMKV